MLSVVTKPINLIAFMLNVFMLVVILSNALTHKLLLVVNMLKAFMLAVIMLMVFMHAGLH